MGKGRRLKAISLWSRALLSRGMELLVFVEDLKANSIDEACDVEVDTDTVPRMAFSGIDCVGAAPLVLSA